MYKSLHNASIAGIAALALATLIGCANEDAGAALRRADPDEPATVRLEIEAGTSPATGAYTVRVRTPHTTVRKPLVLGDQSDPANHTYFDLALRGGDWVEIAVEAEGTVMIVGQCTIVDATLTSSVKATVWYDSGSYNYVKCEEGLQQD